MAVFPILRRQKALRAMIPAERALVILGVQRTGTMLLAEDIASLGILGVPGEHFLRAEEQGGSFRPQARRFAESGLTPGGGAVFAVTLMINYLESFGHWLRPSFARREKRAQARDRAIRFFTEGFDRPLFVTLARAPLWEAAYSQARAELTGELHRRPGTIDRSPRKVAWRPGDPVAVDPARVLARAAAIADQQAEIDALLARHAIAPLRLTYSEIVGAFPVYLGRVAEAAGFPAPDLSTARRTQTKLLPAKEVAQARAALAAYLGLGETS
jgi:LPS sulfotransferase NodH